METAGPSSTKAGAGPRLQQEEARQGVVRIAVTAAVLAWFLVPAVAYGQATGAVVVGGSYLAFALGWLAWVHTSPARPAWRRFLPNVTDPLGISAAMALSGPWGTLIYPAYLWVILGNGARFGLASLYLSSATGVAGLGGVILWSPFWGDHRTMAAGLVIGLVAVPAYIQRLLRRIHSLNSLLNGQLDQARFQATHDELTGLVNRRYFIERVEEEIRRANRQAATFDLVFLDLDDFKAINDNFGHLNGDAVLREVAQRVRTTLRHSDVLGRLGGDEFALLLPGGGCDLVVERIRDTFREPFTSEGGRVPLRASFGASRYPRDGTDFGALLAHADAAMYAAKARKELSPAAEAGDAPRPGPAAGTEARDEG